MEVSKHKKFHHNGLFVLFFAFLMYPSWCRVGNATLSTQTTMKTSQRTTAMKLNDTAGTSKKNITIPVLAPNFGFEDDRFGYSVAIKYAIDLINNRTDILKDYHLIPDVKDTIASIQKTMVAVHEIIDTDKCLQQSPPPAVIGPSFSGPTIASARSFTLFRMLQYTYGATSPELDNHYVYKYLVRMYPGSMLWNKANIAMLKRFGWTRVGIIFDHHDSDGLFVKIAEDLTKKLRENNITIAGVESVDAGYSRLATSDEEITGRLERLKAADIKVFFAQFTHVRAYRIFCKAYKLGMFGKNYVWIVHPRAELVDKWLKTPSTYPGATETCKEKEYTEFSERMFRFEPQDYRDDGKRTISGLTVDEYRDYVDKRRVKNAFLDTNHHTFIFDTAWSMALALNKSIPALAKMNSSLDDLLYKNPKQGDLLVDNAHSVEFEGISGTVRLNKEEGRMAAMKLFQVRDKKNVLVGLYHGTTGKLQIHKDNDFLWIDGVVPSDSSRQKTVIRNIPLALFLPICTVAGLGIILAIGVLIFNIYHRNERYIRKSAPLFNNIIIVGVIMCLCTVLFFGYPIELGNTDKFLLMCKLRFWILCLGFSLSFGSMFVKTWRVYKIFTNRKLKYSIDRLSNSSLIAMVSLIVAVDVIILLLWTFISPMEVKINSLPKENDPDDPSSIHLPILYTCHSDHQEKWLTTIYVLKGILLLYGLFLAYETRNVQFEHLNDSRMIGVCVYNCGVMSILGVLLRIILNESYYKESYGITAICIIFPSLGTLFLIFLPKVVRFVKRDHLSDSETTEGVVIEGPGARNNHDFHLRKDSVCSEGVTSVSSSIPCSTSRIMPIYEEANQASVSPTDASEVVNESSA